MYNTCYPRVVSLLAIDQPLVNQQESYLQSLLVGQGAPAERVVLDAPGLHLEPVLLVLPLRRAGLRRGKDSGEQIN